MQMYKYPKLVFLHQILRICPPNSKKLGSKCHICHYSKKMTDRGAASISWDGSSLPTEAFANLIHYCFLSNNIRSFSYTACQTHMFDSYTPFERFKSSLAGAHATWTHLNQTPTYLQMLASVASGLVWRFNFRGAARWWTRGLAL